VIYGEIAMIWQENVENTKNSRHISSQSVTISARDNTVPGKSVERKNNSLHIFLPTITRSLQPARGLSESCHNFRLDAAAPAQNARIPVKYVARISKNLHIS
jgi:hypothetical protein